MLYTAKEWINFELGKEESVSFPVNYHILLKFVTCDTFGEVKLYILSLIREIHQEKTRTEAVASAPN